MEYTSGNYVCYLLSRFVIFTTIVFWLLNHNQNSFHPPGPHTQGLGTVRQPRTDNRSVPVNWSPLHPGAVHQHGTGNGQSRSTGPQPTIMSPKGLYTSCTRYDSPDFALCMYNPMITCYLPQESRQM